MEESDFLVLFSNYENLPCVIVEAFACGLPVISTDVGGIKEHLDNKKGLLIRKGNEDELYNALNKMLDNQNNYDKSTIRKYAVDNFSYEVVCKSFVELYKTALTNG